MENIKLPKSKEEVIKMFGTNTTDEPIRCLKTHLDMIKELKQIKEDMKPLEARKKFIENQIAVYMMNHEMLVTDDGVAVAIWKFDEGLRFNQSKFKSENKELYDKYCTEKTRRFLIK